MESISSSTNYMNLAVPLAWGCVLGLVVYWVHRFLNWVWFTPKKLERCLREQGLKGNSYRLFLGDQYESGKLINDALSRPIPIDGNVPARIMPHIIKTVATYGKNSFMWVGRIPRLHIGEPEMVKEIFTKYYIFHKNHHSLDPITKHLLAGIGSLEGEPWAARRRTLNPAFYLQKLKLMLPAIHSSCEDMVNQWKKLVPPGTSAEVDVWHYVEALTGDVISRTIFGCNYEEGRRIFQIMKELSLLVTQVTQSIYIPGRRFLPTKTNNRIRALDKEAKARITKIINEKVKGMKAGIAKNDDLLGMLLESNQNEIKEQGNNKNAGMSIDEIIGECKLIFFAGQETSSALHVWTMVLLSRHPEWQTRAREEVLEVFGDKTPDYDGINRLKIVTMILYETLRLYPPVIEMTKVAQEDTMLGKIMVPAGVHVMMPAIMVQQDTEIWGEDATEFKPERFSEGLLKATESQLGSFFPFSLGPRMCIGQNLALLEAKMAVAMYLKHFSFELSPSYVHAPYGLMTVQPQYGAHLILHGI